LGILEEYGLRRVINAYDKATPLGGARVPPEVARAVAAILPEVVEMDALQAVAGRAIVEASGAEWGCVTACAAAAITLGVAACMTGADPARVAQLPDTTGMKRRVVIQKGHCIKFGAPVEQMIRLSGAEVAPAGDEGGCQAWQVEAALAKGGVAALMAVESYHTVGYAGLRLPEMAAIARKAGVPLVVDAATQELRLREIVAMGPDLVGCSAHKYFRSTTAGVVAGRRDLVEAVKLQNTGIGRPMKAGKEAVIGLIAAIRAGMGEASEEWRRRERAKVDRILERLSVLVNAEVTRSPDPNGCPFDRVQLRLKTDRFAPRSLRDALMSGEPAVCVRVYNPHLDSVFLNATEMTEDEVEAVCDRMAAVLG